MIQYCPNKWSELHLPTHRTVYARASASRTPSQNLQTPKSQRPIRFGFSVQLAELLSRPILSHFTGRGRWALPSGSNMPIPQILILASTQSAVQWLTVRWWEGAYHRSSVLHLFALWELASPSCSSLMASFRFAFVWGPVGDMVCASCELSTTVWDNLIWYTWLGDDFLGISALISGLRQLVFIKTFEIFDCTPVLSISFQPIAVSCDIDLRIASVGYR